MPIKRFNISFIAVLIFILVFVLYFFTRYQPPVKVFETVIAEIDTSITTADQLALDFSDLHLSGDSIQYTYKATGGKFDTLANGDIVWIPPQVDHDTTFVITIEATNAKGEKSIKTIRVHVSPGKGSMVSKQKSALTTETIVDTILQAGQFLKLVSAISKKSNISYWVDGGRIDTLKNGDIVWRAPAVTSDTTFTITVKTVHPDGTTETKIIHVKVKPPSGKEDSLKQAISEIEKDSLLTITGTLTDKDGNPLAGVEVRLGNKTAITDDNGRYTFSNVPRSFGEIPLTIVSEKSGTITRKVDLSKGSNEQFNFILQAEGIKPPRGLHARAVPDSVYLQWRHTRSRSLFGYNVYRSTDEFKDYKRLNSFPIVISKLTDTDVKDSVRYYYKVASVNKKNNESDLTKAVSVIVPIKLFVVKKVYDSPYANPTGIVFDGKRIWTCDNLKGEIYKHDLSMAVEKTYKSPGKTPTGLTWDGKHIWSCDFKTGTIYKHGKNMKIIAKYKGPSFKLTDLTWDGTYLWVCNSNGALFQLSQNGKLLNSYRSPYSLSTGLVWDGKTLWVSSIHSKKIYKLTPAMKIDAQYESPFLLSDGFAWDGKHFWACGKVTEKIYTFVFH